MSDKPYETGFLEEIKAVNFGGQFLAVGLDVTQLLGLGASPIVTLSFPGMAAGTPGLQIYPNTFSKWPKKITAGDLVNPVRTGAGLAFRGFGVREITPTDVAELDSPVGHPPGFVQQLYTNGPIPGGGHVFGGHEFYFDIGKFGSAPFPVRIVWNTKAASGSPLDLLYFPDHNAIKVGASLPPPPKVHTTGFFSPSGPTTFTHNYTVNPTKRTVVTA